MSLTNIMLMKERKNVHTTDPVSIEYHRKPVYGVRLQRCVVIGRENKGVSLPFLGADDAIS